MKKKSLSNRIENIIKNTPEIINDKPFKEVVNNLYNILQEYGYSKNYIRIMVHKTTVNNKARVTLGEAGDFFIHKNKKYFIFNENDDVKIVRYDKDIAKMTSEAYQDIRAKKYNEFLNAYKKSGFQISNPIKTNKKILIVAQCSKAKQFSINKQRAVDMYTGPEMKIFKKFLNKSVNDNIFPPSRELYSDNIDFYILSAGYGLIEKNTLVDHYDNSFNSIDKRDAVNFGRDTKVRKTLDELISTNNYDIIFMCLSISYLNVLDLSVDFSYDNVDMVFMTSPKILDCTIQKPTGKNVSYVFLDAEKHPKIHRSSQISLKGKILTSFLIKNDVNDLSINADYIQQYSDNRPRA